MTHQLFQLFLILSWGKERGARGGARTVFMVTDTSLVLKHALLPLNENDHSVNAGLRNEYKNSPGTADSILKK